MSARKYQCLRCGHRYETPARPTCECAGDPPVKYGTRDPLPNFHPEMRKYLDRVRHLRCVPEYLPKQ